MILLIYLLPYITQSLEFTAGNLDSNRNSGKKAEDFPHHVLIVYRTLYCSGSLIASRIVLTTASCFSARQPSDHTVIKVGTTSMVAFGQVINVIEIIEHEFYKLLSWLDNDIALLVLEENVIFGNNVKKICLMEAGTFLKNEVSLTVTGWGSTDLPDKYLNQLVWTEMTVLNRKSCREQYGLLITPSNYCAKYDPTKPLSDNGGSALLDNVLVGIVSYGATHRDLPNIAILTNVSYLHRWIEVNTKSLLKKYCLVTPADSEEDEDYGV